MVKDMEQFNGPKRAVVVANLGEETTSITVDVAALGFKGNVKVYDCFKHEFRPELGESFTLEIAPHDSEAFYVTGKRLEQSVYQAEAAFMNAYTEINEQDYESYRRPYEIPSPRVRESASSEMGYYVTELGGWAENWLEWRNVYSEKGGKYVLSLRYACPESRNVSVSVNGQDVSVLSLNSGDELEWKDANVSVKLSKGWNTVRLSNPTEKMPSFDRMTVKKM